MNPRTWTSAALSLLAPLSAHAHGGGEAMLETDNHFDGEAEVWVDGRYAGAVAGDATARFETRPGMADVTVRRPDTGYVLASARLHLHKGTTVTLPIDPPPGTLRVENDGEIGLHLDVGARDVWVAPGAAVELRVGSGRVELRASVHEPRGEWVAIERTVWVEPGRPTEVELRPDPTVVVVSNDELVPLRILLDGAEAGWIAPGQDRRIWVRPGPTTLVMLDAMGRVREEARLVVARGQEVHVAATSPVAGAPASDHCDRPGGPIRVVAR